tara:strand:+ start:1341 stop:1646 length:306 start_codon:yes stop_codon:yes gene_type:complete
MKKTVELSTKRKVEIREMSIDDIDYCEDQYSYTVSDNNVRGLVNLARSRTAWLRHGICGGSFKDYKENFKGHPDDSVLKQLTATEKEELHFLIKEYQSMGE